MHMFVHHVLHRMCWNETLTLRIEESLHFRCLFACSREYACEVTFTHPCNAPTARVNRCCTVLSVTHTHTCLHTHTLSPYDLQYPAVSCVTSNDRSLSLSISLRCLSWCYGSFPCDRQLDIFPPLLMHECVHFYICSVSIYISGNVYISFMHLNFRLCDSLFSQSG